MRREKVVCFVNHTAETGGAEFALARLVHTLDRSEWHPVVVFGEEGPAVDLLRSRSIETYVIPLGAGLGKVRRESLGSLGGMGVGRCFAGVGYVLKLARFFCERGVELVHTNSMKAHVLGGLAARLRRIPLVWHLRDSLHPLCLPPLPLKGMRFLARCFPDAVVAVSKSVARDALGEGGDERAHVVYDGLGDDVFSARAGAPPGTGREARTWTVGIAGRLCEWKGQHLFLEAAADLIEKGLDIRFEVLGGPLFGQERYAQRLKQFVASSGLSPHVFFRGFVSDVSTRIQSWDLLVHASTAPDPCPNVVIEAMAAGVPVVGADGGGVPELLDGGACGFLFPMDDARALSQCIEAALNDEVRRVELAAAARERAERCFKAARVAREVEAVWGPLVDGRAYKRRAWPWVEGGISAPVSCEDWGHTRVPSNEPQMSRTTDSA